MPFRTTFTRMIHLEVLASPHFDTYESRFFERTYVPEDTNGERFLYAGMVIALNHATQKFVPYNATASYGAGSDVPVMVNTEPYDMTFGEKVITGVFHAMLVEANCYLYGGARGTIPAAVKAATALTQIQWI